MTVVAATVICLCGYRVYLALGMRVVSNNHNLSKTKLCALQPHSSNYINLRIVHLRRVKHFLSLPRLRRVCLQWMLLTREHYLEITCLETLCFKPLEQTIMKSHLVPAQILSPWVTGYSQYPLHQPRPLRCTHSVFT